MQRRAIVVLLVCLLVSACKLPEQGAATTTSLDTSEMTELIQLLQTAPGLQITNRGGEPQVLIRGARSLQGENLPLYVLDGVPLGRSYDEANAAIDLPRVQDLRVLSPANATRYGARGQNGVIEIRTKN